jgi:hypothetical protein
VAKGKNLPEVGLWMSRKESGNTAASIGVSGIYFSRKQLVFRDMLCQTGGCFIFKNCFCIGVLGCAAVMNFWC